MRRFVHSERGATTAEFALILPVLLLFVMGLMEGSRVLNVWMVLTNETREAARYGIAGVRDATSTGAVSPTLVSDVTSYAQSSIGQMLDTTPLTVTVPAPATDASGFPISLTVTASYQVTIVVPLVSDVLGTVPVSATSTMRAE